MARIIFVQGTLVETPPRVGGQDARLQVSYVDLSYIKAERVALMSYQSDSETAASSE